MWEYMKTLIIVNNRKQSKLKLIFRWTTEKYFLCYNSQKEQILLNLTKNTQKPRRNLKYPDLVKKPRRGNTLRFVTVREGVWMWLEDGYRFPSASERA